MVFSLKEAEARLEASKGTTIGDSVPQEQTTHHTSVLPKKTTKARKVKAPTSNLEVVKRALVLSFPSSKKTVNLRRRKYQKKLGMDSRQLGKALSKLDIKSKSIRSGR